MCESRGYGLMGAVGEVATIGQRRGETAGQAQACDQARCLQDGEKTVCQAEVIDVGRCFGAGTVCPVIAQGHCMHRHRGIDRALEQCGVEGQQAVAGRRGAFRLPRSMKTVPA
jgi:hypothetical protein